MIYMVVVINRIKFNEIIDYNKYNYIIQKKIFLMLIREFNTYSQILNHKRSQMLPYKYIFYCRFTISLYFVKDRLSNLFKKYKLKIN